jgi:hypothetical protein
MTGTHPLYEACHELFTGYPLATRNLNRSGTVRSMVLMLLDGDDAGYFVLTHDHNEGKAAYSLWSWPDGDTIDIGMDNDASSSDLTVKAVTHGIPIPRDGSLFGWKHEAAITALIVVYAAYTPAYPEPGWAVMPLMDASESRWPPFTGKQLFGHWSWKEYRAERIVSLDDVIAETSEAVCWVDTKAILGSDCCVVTRDIRVSEGCVLQRGRYVYYQALREGKPVPSVRTLLTNPEKIDLAPRFQLHTLSGH